MIRPSTVLNISRSQINRTNIFLERATSFMKIETYRNLIDHIAAPVLILDEQDVIYYVNQDTIDLLGCDTVEQIQGVDFKSYISPEHRDVFNQSCQSIMQDNTSHVCDYILIRQDRSAISVQLT